MSAGVVNFSSLDGPKILGGCLFSICFKGVTQGNSANPIGKLVGNWRSCFFCATTGCLT